LLTLSILYFRVDVLLVGALRGAADTGLYAAALTIYSTALLLPEAALAAVYPRLAASFSRSPEGYVEASKKCARVLVVAMLPVMAALVMFAAPLLDLVYGERFAGGVVALRLLALSLPLHALNGALGQALQAGHLQSVVLKVVTTTLAAHIALNLVLISIYGIAGAPMALLLSSAIAVVGNLLAFQRRVSPSPAAHSALRSAS
jgi:O-antigen/teichoic acid export membrane protein